MARFFGEPDDLVFDRWAIARADPADLSGVHRAGVKVLADQPMDALVGGRQPTESLGRRELSCSEGKGNGRIVSTLRFAGRVVHRVAMDPGRSACLEASELQTQAPQALRKAPGRGFSDTAAFRRFRSHVHEAPQERAGRDDDRVRFQTPAVVRDDANHSAARLEEVLGHSFDERQFRGTLQGPPGEPGVQRPIALCPRPPDRGAARAVQHPELNPGSIGQGSHEPSESVHLSRELSLGQTPDRRVAGHPADRREIAR